MSLLAGMPKAPWNRAAPLCNPGPLSRSSQTLKIASYTSFENIQTLRGCGTLIQCTSAQAVVDRIVGIALWAAI
jgi:hypothetical protein